MVFGKKAQFFDVTGITVNGVFGNTFFQFKVTLEIFNGLVPVHKK